MNSRKAKYYVRLRFSTHGGSGAAVPVFAGKRQRFPADQKLPEGDMCGRRLQPLCAQARPQAIGLQGLRRIFMQ